MFANPNDFSLHIEKIKTENDFETYMEAVVFYYENETDHEMEEISKMLNQKIKDSLLYEAMKKGMMKENNIIELI